MQPVAPAAEENPPGAQAKHPATSEGAPLALPYRPGAHGVQELDPCAAYLPAVQLLHVAADGAPLALLLVPAAQGRHTFPATALKSPQYPGPQGPQAPPGSRAAPSGHSVLVAEKLALGLLDAAAEAVPLEAPEAEAAAGVTVAPPVPVPPLDAVKEGVPEPLREGVAVAPWDCVSLPPEAVGDAALLPDPPPATPPPQPLLAVGDKLPLTEALLVVLKDGDGVPVPQGEVLAAGEALLTPLALRAEDAPAAALTLPQPEVEGDAAGL